MNTVVGVGDLVPGKLYRVRLRLADTISLFANREDLGTEMVFERYTPMVFLESRLVADGWYECRFACKGGIGWANVKHSRFEELS